MIPNHRRGRVTGSNQRLTGFVLRDLPQLSLRPRQRQAAATKPGTSALDVLFGVLGAPAVAAEETARALQPNADASAGWMGADIDQVNEER